MLRLPSLACATFSLRSAATRPWHAVRRGMALLYRDLAGRRFRLPVFFLNPSSFDNHPNPHVQQTRWSNENEHPLLGTRLVNVFVGHGGWVGPASFSKKSRNPPPPQLAGTRVLHFGAGWTSSHPCTGIGISPPNALSIGAVGNAAGARHAAGSLAAPDGRGGRPPGTAAPPPTAGRSPWWVAASPNSSSERVGQSAFYFPSKHTMAIYALPQRGLLVCWFLVKQGQKPTPYFLKFLKIL